MELSSPPQQPIAWYTSRAFWDQYVSANRRAVALRIVVFGFFVAFTVLGKQVIFYEPVDCIEDRLFSLTAPLNEWIRSNLTAQRVFLIFSSACVDIVFLTVFSDWVLRGGSCRFPVCLVLFYTLRYITQNVFTMRYPEGYVWAYPGFPSLTVPYGPSNDFFFSGHVGFSTLAALEFKERKMRKCFIFGCFVLLVEAFVMIIFRGHYTIDVMFGFIVGHYVLMLSTQVSIKLDQWMFEKFPTLRRVGPDIYLPLLGNANGNDNGPGSAAVEEEVQLPADAMDGTLKA
eukprot:GILK01014457.1.p1 GENE.GILK01014457.1~~GILK01014457.1.p1  ORF type:complete len:286 (+),score=20.05 GILK01014457.1:64-921(+)